MSEVKEKDLYSLRGATKSPVRDQQEIGQKATGKRIAALVLWVAGISAELVGLLTLDGAIQFSINKIVVAIIAILLDLALVIAGSQMWKQANQQEKGSGSFLKNQLGLIVSVAAFFPLVFVLLLNKDLDKKTRNTALIVGVCCLVLWVAILVL